jgi:uncharacterized protein YraI
VTTGKTIAGLLAACVTAGCFMVAGQPAEAAARPIDRARVGNLSRDCSYRVSHLRRGSFLNLRKGPGLRYRRIGKLRAADGRLSGACQTTRKPWVAVKTPNGNAGWASTRYLRDAGNLGLSAYPALDCSYQVSHVRRGGFLNLRKGPGLRYRRIGKLRTTDGRLSGACQTTRKPWVAVKSAKGKTGWASTRYLRK